ncbi:FHA domain-containing protein [Diaphorobacter aerolatus]|uniref:FHA domain-containing protein n=1 Tax=Diaphorobacter aerolatus TaxID=1288495 RepID=A0A7H0GGS0_9BURK|nr:FHA domain-containing protein [Diaphorobacter aerolatus]QNP47486.1 FHA domain-containing protein [Diaphorobacter aerolatus]
MPKMVVSVDGVVIKEVPLTKERTTLGRRPYNDVVIDNLAVSGEHALLHMAGDDVEIEDLGSTNGTHVNGKSVKRHKLRGGDTIELGRYKIRFVDEAPGGGHAVDFEKTMLFKPGMALPKVPNSRPAPLMASTPLQADVKVLSGAAAGRQVSLVKVVTTIGKPGVAVAAITKRHHGFVLAHVEGDETPMLNGEQISKDPVPLKDGDRIEIVGTTMLFIQR